MRRRQWLAVALLVAGASLLIAASFASAGTSCNHALKKGGIFRYGNVGASVQVDPQVGYVTTAWSLEYATAAKLYNYPDAKGPAGSKLIPEVASKFTVSKNGRRYTSSRSGRASSSVTARRSPRRTSSGRSTARRTTTWLRRAAVHHGPDWDEHRRRREGADGQGTSVSGVVAKGNKLTISLTKADGTFMAKITMPFFQATSTKLPLTKEVVNVTGKNLPSAGPYYMTRNDPTV
jgi:ABC-type oligopeptide transport system substrate-binding subunit